MKKVRNSLALLLVFALCAAVSGGSAFASGIIVDKPDPGFLAETEAEGAQYRSTRAFIAAMESEGYSYTLGGVDEDGDELVTTEFEVEGGDIQLYFYFNSNEENANVRVWNVIDYDVADWANVVQVLDGLNGDYKFVRFYTDDYDNSVTAALDLIYRDNDVGEICLEALYYVLGIVESALPLLAPYAI